MKFLSLIFRFSLIFVIFKSDLVEAKKRGSAASAAGGSSWISPVFAVRLKTLGDKTIALGKNVDEIKGILAPIAEGKEAFDTIIVNRFAAQYQATKSGTLDEKEQNFLYWQALTDYHHSKCELTKKQDDCTKAKRELEDFRKLAKFQYEPQIIDIPTYDLANKKMTYQGSVYDIKSGKVVSSSPATQIATTTNGPVKKDIAVDVPSGSTNEALNYTCVWKSDLQRKILRSPSCNTSGNRICSGYVNCEKNGRSFTRLATCAESLCGDAQASECSKQPNFGSRNPDTDDTTFTDEKAVPKAGVKK